HVDGTLLRAERVADAGGRKVDMAVDIVRQRLQRRDIDDLCLVLEAFFEPLAHQSIDGAEERGERLAGAGRRGDQHVAAGLYGGPSVSLRGCRRGETLVEPGADRRVEEVERH